VYALGTAFVLLFALWGYGSLRLQTIAESTTGERPLTVALVQANLDDYEGLRARIGAFDTVALILSDHERLSRRALEESASGEPIELLVWPETVYPTTFGKPKSPEGADFDVRIVDFAATANVPLMFGSYDRDDDHEFIAAMLVQHDADDRAETTVYRKRSLFPLTEATPQWLESAFVRGRLPWLGTWHAGDGARILPLRRHDGGSLQLAPLICLDAVAPTIAIEAARLNADVLVTLSNDAWFAGTRGTRLHLVVSAFRSIETRLPQLRATNTGISAVIDATGEIRSSTAVNDATVLVGTVTPGSRAKTLMVQWGDWFGPATTLVALSVVFWVTVRRRLRPSGRSSSRKKPRPA
jgi:apolipoprotein N-acyltransferase